MSHKIRAKIGVLLIVLAALFSNLKLFKDIAAGYRNAGEIDGVSIYEKRFEGIKNELPARGVVGYIDGTDVKDIRFAGQETAKYYLTQYAVSPTIIEYTSRDSLIIGNFEPGTDNSKTISEKRLTVVKDLGNGVMLLKGEKK